MAIFVLLSLEVLVPRQLVCLCCSVNIEWSVRVDHVAVIALHICRKFHSQIFSPLKPLTILWMFMCQVNKLYKEIRSLKTGLGQDALEVWGLNLLSKQWGSRFAKIHSPEIEDHVLRAGHIDPINFALHQWWSTRELTGVWRDTSLLLLWRRSDGQEQNSPSNGMPRTGLKVYSSRMRKSSPSSSSTNTRMTRWRSNVLWGKGKVSKGVERPSPFLHDGLVECPIRRWHFFIFMRWGWKPVPKYI